MLVLRIHQEKFLGLDLWSKISFLFALQEKFDTHCSLLTIQFCKWSISINHFD